MNLKDVYYVGDIAKLFGVHVNYFSMLAKQNDEPFVRFGHELFVKMPANKMKDSSYLTAGLRQAYKETMADPEKAKELKDFAGKFPYNAIKDEIDLTPDDLKFLEEEGHIEVKKHPNRSGSSWNYIEFKGDLLKAVLNGDTISKVTDEEFQDEIKANRKIKGDIFLREPKDGSSGNVLMWY